MKSFFHQKMVYGVGAFIAYALFSAFLLVPGKSIVGSPFYLIGSVGMFTCMFWIMKQWPGRQLISSCINAAQNDVIVLLQAEVRLLPGAISRMLKVLQENDSAVGGCFGATYDSSSGFSLRLNWLVPALHQLWFVASGICTGGQVMFFRRVALQGSLPVFKSMANIELSLRIKENGATVFVPGGVACTSRKPKPSRNWTDLMIALYVTLSYLTLRRLGSLTRSIADGYPAVSTPPANKQATR